MTEAECCVKKIERRHDRHNKKFHRHRHLKRGVAAAKMCTRSVSAGENGFQRSKRRHADAESFQFAFGLAHLHQRAA